LNPIPPPEGTVTIVFTDIVGSTALRDRLVAAYGDGEGNDRYRQQLLDPHDRCISRLLFEHHGYEVKRIGDSFMAAFAQPADAVLCAVAIQRSLHDDPIATDHPDQPLAVRIGMHTGPVMLRRIDGTADYDGHTVNIAARVEAMLAGGERVYCSGQTHALARTGANSGIRAHSYGRYTLKGVDSEEIEIVELLWRDDLQPKPPRPPDLPYPWITPWVGRERETRELREALQSSKLVTLRGMGGVGKTRLAVESLLRPGGSLPRDLVFVDLAEGVTDSPDALFAAVRDALALTESDAPTLDILYRRLKGGDRLLILDNFETVMSAATVARRLASITGVRVLVTSQQALGISGECVVAVDPMPTDGELATLESYQLFAKLARSKDLRWEPEDATAMREVLAATDGLPYLIELVAAVAPKRQLRQLLSELLTHLTAVRARSGFAATGRHESVQACLEWALARLPAEGREALPRLSVFAGGFDEVAALAVAGTPLSTLDLLVDASLLSFNRGNGRYAMLASTRQFARERLGSEETERLEAEHARWFSDELDHAHDALRREGGETQNDARLWIDIEWENVEQAVTWAEAKDPALFHRAVFALADYLDQKGRTSEKVRLYEELLGRLDPEADGHDWGAAHNNLGNAYADLPTGDHSENLKKAIGCYEAALRVYTERDFPRDWAATLNNLGTAYGDLLTGDRGENLAQAIACHEAALRVRTERDAPLQWASTQNNLGIAYTALPTGDRTQNLSRAIACYEAVLRVRTERDSPLEWASTQNNLGIAYADMPDDRGESLDKAIACYESALRVRTEDDFPRDWAATQNNLGVAFWKLPTGRGENVAKAITCFEASLRIRTERDFPMDWAMTQHNLGLAFASRSVEGDRPRAIACFLAAERGYLAVGEGQRAEKMRRRAAEFMTDSE
jgi:class 3 adenylate cyclase/predicted ATPase